MVKPKEGSAEEPDVSYDESPALRSALKQFRTDFKTVAGPEMKNREDGVSNPDYIRSLAWKFFHELPNFKREAVVAAVEEAVNELVEALVKTSSKDPAEIKRIGEKLIEEVIEQAGTLKEGGEAGGMRGAIEKLTAGLRRL